MRSLFPFIFTHKQTNCHNENDKPYTVGPRITTNGAKNGQNGTRCSVARKWALAQRTDQWCKDKDDVNREEPFSHYFYPSFNRPKEGEQIGESFFFLLLTIHNRCPSFFGQNCVLRLRTTTHYILITFFVNLLLNPAKPIKNIWFCVFITLRSLINEHARLFFSRKKSPCQLVF